MDTQPTDMGQTPPDGQEEDITFLKGIDETNITQETWRSLNKIYSYISHLVNFRYHLLIYRLIKNNWVKMDNLEKAAGQSKQRLYKIANDFETREINRRAEVEE